MEDLKKMLESCQKAIESCEKSRESCQSALESCVKAQKKATLAIKIALGAVFVSGILGILALWTLLNQVTVSVGIDKKLIEIEARLDKIDNGDKRAKQGESK